MVEHTETSEPVNWFRKAAGSHVRKKNLPKVDSYQELREKANLDIRYQKLAVIAAGLPVTNEHLSVRYAAAMVRLLARLHETDEKGMIAEVNAVRDQLK
jgi:hypothetical protein